MAIHFEDLILERASALTRIMDHFLARAPLQTSRQLILDALESNGWNRQGTADTLGINRTTLYKKMKKYGISFEQQLMS